MAVRLDLFALDYLTKEATPSPVVVQHAKQVFESLAVILNEYDMLRNDVEAQPSSIPGGIILEWTPQVAFYMSVEIMPHESGSFVYTGQSDTNDDELAPTFDFSCVLAWVREQLELHYIAF